MSQELVSITVDGKTVEVPKGMLLVEAAKLAKVNIPVFCHHPKLEPAGVCRMCLVEVEGQRKPVTACTMPVSDGMIVRTETETVDTLRKGVIEFLLLNHPLDCPVCDKGGECPLQDQTYTYGPATSRSLDPKQRMNKAVDLGNFIVLDQERCIMCRRCTRFDDEITHENNLIIGERAHEVVVTTADGERYNSYFSGNTIELCPVGALTSELYRFQARPWDVAKVPSVCNGCSVGCNTRLDFRFDNLLRVVSRDNPEVDGGWLCDRGRFNYKYVDADNRLQRPMVRRDGQLVPVSWREALGDLAKRLAEIKAAKGGQAVGIIGGGRLTNEEAHLLQKLARLGLGTNNVDHRVGRQVIASHAKYSGRMTDVSDADGVLIVDTLLAERAPVLDLRVRRAGVKGRAKLVAVGSAFGEYRAPLTKFPALPGAVAKVLAEPAVFESLQDRKKVVAIWGGHDPDAGVALLALLDRLASAGVTVRLLIPGEQNNSRGAEAAGLLPGHLPGGRRVDDAAAREEIGRILGGALPSEKGLDTEGMLKAAASGSLEALLLVGANPAQTYHDGNLVAEALDKVPFLVAVDLFLTESAQKADIVLPAVSFIGKAGAYTTLDGLVQRLDPARAPEFETWPDGQIFTGLAELLEVPIYESDEALARELTKLGLAPQDNVLSGLPKEAADALLKSASSLRTEPGDGLVLLPVERLFAGGGTSHFDSDIAHARPGAVGYMHPDDAASLGVSDGDTVAVSSGTHELVVTVGLDRGVLAGTLQVPAGLPELPVSRWVREGNHPRVTLNRRVMEEVG